MSANDQAGSANEPDVLDAAARWLDRDGRIAMATVIDTWGSSPVPVGGQMVIAADGDFQGSVSGGCIEGEIISEAGDLIARGGVKSLEFGVADDTAWNAGLPCGGKVRVLVERIEAGSENAGHLIAALEARRQREGLLAIKSLAGGRTEVLRATSPNLPPELADRFRTAKSGVLAGPDGDVFVHALVPPARIVAIGATHITQVLVSLARLSGYEIVVIDPRTAFASPARFPGTTLVTEWPQDALPRIGLDAYTVLCVLAHVDHIDDEALKFGLGTDCRFIAALGSSRTHARRRERLLAAGLTEAAIARIKNPIGLDIGAQTPAEIALSVMAEVVLAVRGTKRKS